MKFFHSLKLDTLLLPLVGILLCLGGWAIIAGKSTITRSVDDWGDPITKVERHGIAKNLPSPTETWEASKPYLVEPLAKRGELDQGMLRFAALSLELVAKGYFIALLIGTPIGFLLGLSKNFTRAFDPIIQILRPVSPLAWLPLGMVLFAGLSVVDANGRVTFGTSDAAALFTIAICAMWPTVLNTAVGVRAVPQDYLNVAKVLKLSPAKTLFKILIPSALPYMFTGFRLSLGIAWLVIVAVEMLIGKPGVGGFLWQQYNANSYAHIILSILTIGVIGFVLDRLMSMIEARFRTA
ncbi:MAG: nitrate ABC transporter, permease protein [Verrucomicrobia bacterium]|nr:MAG: nitrate ABC transporter, permease protein [Verrucomicrobiota bacterium]TAE86200.1 MAG: nitrate ABC transporter, permease protein [Verrucomicrobiota bacterium]TAF23646.1 MAG: nitrate ABC transporter, permease protein [Verrucomicrobiota bacterium]TAF40189.1 MAG: nitrate ABC transporter, permease protein [Verrucomicrobiota bacterium]